MSLAGYRAGGCGMSKGRLVAASTRKRRATARTAWARTGLQEGDRAPRSAHTGQGWLSVTHSARIARARDQQRKHREARALSMAAFHKPNAWLRGLFERHKGELEERVWAKMLYHYRISGQLGRLWDSYWDWSRRAPVVNGQLSLLLLHALRDVGRSLAFPLSFFCPRFGPFLL
eukprot:g3142.t1